MSADLDEKLSYRVFWKLRVHVAEVTPPHNSDIFQNFKTTRLYVWNCFIQGNHRVEQFLR